MQNVRKLCLSRRVMGIFCALVLFISALYVPVIVNAAPSLTVTEDETTVFTFDDTCISTDAANKAEFDATGLGYAGWGSTVADAIDEAGNKVYVATRSQNQTWDTSGALRLNKKVGDEYQLYTLEPSTTYVVSMDVRVLSSSVFTDDAKTEYECYISMGYGAVHNTNDTNYVNSLSTVLQKIVSTKAGSGSYTLFAEESEQSYACGSEWRTVTYQFTTPADFGNKDTALSLYATTRTSFRAEIDNLAVTKLAATTGIVVLNDEYSGRTDIVYGTVGEEYALPDISDRAQQSDHTFAGWYSDEGRTQKIEAVAFAEDMTVVYTGWRAPVTITFEDKLNGTSETATGMAGEAFEYPVDPVDPAGEQWFMGWYTTEGYTEAHTSGEFGYANATLYAYWKSETPGIVQDFENYTKNEYTVKESNGVVSKSNILYFSTAMEKQSEVTYGDSGNAIKFVWDSSMVKDNSDPNTYDASSRYSNFDNVMWIGNGLENNQVYNITFKYKLEKAGSKIEFYTISASSNNSWSSNYVRYHSGYKTYAVSDEWQECTFQFTTNYKTATATTMYLGVRMEKNADTVLYFDDVEITADVQPYESSVTVKTGLSRQEEITLVGKRGEEIVLPSLTHPLGAGFLGYYLDETFETPFESGTFQRNSITVWAKWEKAPTVITFVDNLNGTEEIRYGEPGTSFEYPADPVDKVNATESTWFMGWYTDETYTTEFTDTVFGEEDVTVYSYWKNEISDLYQDFENYNKEQWTPSDNNGVINRSNYLYFFTTMSKQSEVTYGGSGNAVKFVWDSSMVKDNSDPNTYNAATRYNQYDNVIWLGNGIENKQLYNVTFKYRVEKAGSPVKFFISNGGISNSWGYSPVRNLTEEMTLTESTEWQTCTMQITTNFKDSARGNYMYLGVMMTRNADMVIYFDDVAIESVIEPNQAIFYKYPGYGEDSITVVNRGDKLDLSVLEHKGGAEFLGWYADAEFTTPLTQTVVGRENVFAYGKWGPGAITFYNDYPYSSTPGNGFGKAYSFVSGKGIGYNDDYAARWLFDASAVRGYDATTGKPLTWASRGTQKDHIIPIQKSLEDGAVYRVTYYYMATSDTNVGATIKPVSGYPTNIWLNNCYNSYDAATVNISKGGTGWTKAEFYISANVRIHTNANGSAMLGNGLFLQLNTVDNSETNYADIRIDNVFVEKISAPYIFFEYNNSEDVKLVQGKAGEAIAYPVNPTRFGHSFAGWYSDKELTKPFTLKTFAADTAVTAYAAWTAADKVTYSFEKFNLFNGGGIFAFADSQVLDTKFARTGNKAVLFDRTVEYNNGASYIAVAQGKEIFTMDLEHQYLVTVNYYVEEAPTGSISMCFVASSTNFWAGQNAKLVVGAVQSVTAYTGQANAGKWMNKTFVLDTSLITNPNHNMLYLRVTGGADWKIWFDDITITKVPKGQSAVSIENGGCSAIPTTLTGKPGTSFANKLPEAPVIEGMYFKGYYTKDAEGNYAELAREDMKFGEKAYAIYARFIEYEVVENFDNGDYIKKAEAENTYTIYDFDYEIYDSEAEGNSKDNVTSGRYSLHRKGTSMYFENAVILTLGNQISEGEKYTVSFKVKLGDYRQTDGAIKVVSGRSPSYAWTTTGDYYPVVAITDLLDGQWHEVSYTFNSVEAFACIQTPGYVELFMDDFKFSVAGDDAVLSNPVTYTEYVPAKRDAEGNLIEKDDTAVDITSIIDVSLYLDNNGSMLWIIIGVAGGVLVLAVAAAVLIVLLKKKKKSKA